MLGRDVLAIHDATSRRTDGPDSTLLPEGEEPEGLATAIQTARERTVFLASMIN